MQSVGTVLFLVRARAKRARGRPTQEVGTHVFVQKRYVGFCGFVFLIFGFSPGATNLAQKLTQKETMQEKTKQLDNDPSLRVWMICKCLSSEI